MSVTHNVLVQFKDDLKAEDIQKICQDLMQLKKNCIHPTTQAPYILSLKGGKDNSHENLQGGITHGFAVEFASAEDRDYYSKEDPVHLAFAKDLVTFVTKVIVVDFISEQY